MAVGTFRTLRDARIPAATVKQTKRGTAGSRVIAPR